MGWDVARDDRRAVRGGLQQCQGKSLERRGQHEGRRVRVELTQHVPVHVTRELDPRVVAGRLAQGRDVRVGEARSSRHDEPAVTGQLPDRADQQIGCLLGDEPSDEQHIGARRQPPPPRDLVGLPRLRGVDAVRDVIRAAFVRGGVVALQVAGDHDRRVGDPRGEPFGRRENRVRDAPPLRALPVAPVDRQDDLRSRERTWEERRDPGPDRMIVDDVDALAHRVLCRDDAVHDRVEMLAIHRRKSFHAHAEVFVDRLLDVVRSRVDDDVVPTGGEPASELLHVVLDAAERSGHAARADHHDPHPPDRPRARTRASSYRRPSRST